MRVLKFLALIAALASTWPAMANDSSRLAVLQKQDMRLARLSYRLMRANVALCVHTMPLTGMILSSRDQYAAPPSQWFANGNVAVEAVLPGSVADRAGITVGDAIVAVGGKPVSSMIAVGGNPLRDTVFWQIAAQSGPVHLTLRRHGIDRHVTISAPRGCRALFEIVTTKGAVAQSNGKIVQISSQLASELNDDQLPVTLAHELAHIILQHHRRLAAAGIKDGLLDVFGRDQRIILTTEVMADRLSVHLLANAGYDPELAVRFWKGNAPKYFGFEIVHDPTDPSNAERARIMQWEIDDYLTLHAGPDWPGHLLARRNQPL